jgi:hypothetical protein
VNSGRYGKQLASYLAQELPRHGYEVANVAHEDWGWRVDLKHESFPLWIGCGNYEEYEDGFLCFIEPSRPYVRRWFRRINTTEVVEALAQALEHVIACDRSTRQLRWWDENEPGR